MFKKFYIYLCFLFNFVNIYGFQAISYIAFGVFEFKLKKNIEQFIYKIYDNYLFHVLNRIYSK